MAGVPFAFECDAKSGFIANPNAHSTVGYVTSLAVSTVGYLPSFAVRGVTGFAPDLTVSLPFKSPSPTYKGLGPVTNGTLKVVGVMENFSWNGTVGGPINIDFYMSQENATRLKALQQSVLGSTGVPQFGWWIGDYDQAAWSWFEKSFPFSATNITGVIAGGSSPELDIDLTPIPVTGGIDVNYYKVSIAVAPAADQYQSYALRFANSSTRSTLKQWGLVVGTSALGAKPAGA
jgi:hypothetical protein